MSLGPGCEGDSVSGMSPAPKSTGAVIKIIFTSLRGYPHYSAPGDAPSVGCRVARLRPIGAGIVLLCAWVFGPLSANSTVDKRGRGRPGAPGSPPKAEG